MSACLPRHRHRRDELDISIISEPTHIAGLPVALTVNCWADRKCSIVFKEGEL